MSEKNNLQEGPLEQYKFTDEEKEGVKKIVRDIYHSLFFKKLSLLLPLSNEERKEKYPELMVSTINDNYLFMIYCFNNFTETQRAKEMQRAKGPKDPSLPEGVSKETTQKNENWLRYFSVPIENVLENDEFYSKLIVKDLPIFDRIAALQKKTRRSFKSTELMYFDMMLKIEETANKVLLSSNTTDPQKLSTIMHFVFDTVRIAQTDLINEITADANVKLEVDPCDANTYLGVDWSFLGIFDKLPEECIEDDDEEEITKISIVKPIKVISGGKSRKHKNLRRQRKTRTSRK